MPLKILFSIALFFAAIGSAFAQTSTANQVTPGFLSTVGCSSGSLTPCFIPYAPSVPKLLNSLSTTVIAIKASAGHLNFLQCYNPNSSQIYVQAFDATAANVTLGTTVPVQSYPIGPTSTGGLAPTFGVGFSTAISIAATTTATGSTAPATALDCNAGYN